MGALKAPLTCPAPGQGVFCHPVETTADGQDTGCLSSVLLPMLWVVEVGKHALGVCPCIQGAGFFVLGAVV